MMNVMNWVSDLKKKWCKSSLKSNTKVEKLDLI